MLNVDIKNLNGEKLFTAEIDCVENTLFSIKLGLAVRKAIANGANLTGAYLTRANLTDAILTGAYLTRAYLTRANLTGANLTDANLTGANLTGANLTGANLTGANLTGANLTGANLTGANLTGANLTGANLTGANLPLISILPEGTLIGWKKLRNHVVAKLEIPSNAKRVNSTGRKCRAEFVKTLELFGLAHTEAYSTYDTEVKYRVGELTYPDKFDPDFRVECSNGIHFFITREEAEAY